MENKSKISVCLVQFNNTYRKNLHFPYSVGLLKAYSEKFPRINDNIDFQPFVYKRDSVEAVVERIGSVEVVGFSCYLWNWQLSLRVAEQIRKRNPSCLIVVGGPQVPHRIDGFFRKYPFLDIACHGEGEITFHEILKTLITGGKLNVIAGLSFHDRSTGEVISNPLRPAISDLDSVRSPYLNGTFDALVEKEKDIKWVGIWETNRGCPYSCSFCSWLSDDSNMVRRLSFERIKKEIEWFGTHKITSIYCSDANFGILDRDKEIAEELVRTKKEYGYPQKLRVCYTKDSNEKVFDIARILDGGDMSMGVSISFQSLNEITLKNIKRNNIRTDDFHDLQSKFIRNNIANFTELIIALPGETYNSFVDGMDTVMENGQHSGISVYHCTILSNTEMFMPEYQQKHGIQTVDIPIFQPHSAPRDAHNAIVEKETIVVATSTMPVKDWRRVYQFAWAVLCFHIMGMLQAVALLLRYNFGIRYADFYRALVRYGVDRPESLVGKELRILDGVLDNVLAGNGFEQYLPQFSEISWRPEEASYLRLSENLGRFYEESPDFVADLLELHNIEPEKGLLDDLFRYQAAVLKNYEPDKDFPLELNFNLNEYVQNCRLGEPVSLQSGNFRYQVQVQPVLAGNKEKFSRKMIWDWRKGGNFFYSLRRL